MPEARVGVRVADDRQTVTIAIAPVGGPSSPVGLNLERLTKMINLLGQARARMVEVTPKQPLDGKTVETVTDPPWYLQVAAIMTSPTHCTALPARTWPSLSFI
jgi:hypothetical protein